MLTIKQLAVGRFAVQLHGRALKEFGTLQAAQAYIDALEP